MLAEQINKNCCELLKLVQITFSSHTVKKYVANYVEIYIIYFKKTKIWLTITKFGKDQVV